MLKFTAGAICGWIAARTLPPAPLAPPTLEELTHLAHKAKVTYEEIVIKFQDKKN